MLGVPVLLRDAATFDDLGLVHAPPPVELRGRGPRNGPRAGPTSEGERGRQAIDNRKHDHRPESSNSLEAMLNDNGRNV